MHLPNIRFQVICATTCSRITLKSLMNEQTLINEQCYPQKYYSKLSNKRANPNKRVDPNKPVGWNIKCTYLISGSELFVPPLGAVLPAAELLCLQILSNPERCRMFSIRALRASSVCSRSKTESGSFEPAAPPG